MATESAGVAPPADPMMTTTTTTTSSQAAEQQDTAATTHDHEGMQQDHDHDHDHDNGRPGRGASSPPLPQRHTAATPGPRAARFQELYAQSLRHTLGKLGWDNVAGCYPTIARGAEGVLRQVQSQMVGKLGDKCEKEFDNILAARQVIAKLNQLEALVGDASHRRETTTDPDPTPPHLLAPSQILAAHAHPSLARHQSHLNARLQTTQSQNALLLDDVRHQRAAIDALAARLEAALDDVRAANDALAPVAADVAREARDAGGRVAAGGADSRP